jgi:hypothetical protein
MRSKIPALCLSGGKLSEFCDKAVEYRVWIHPYSGDDCFFKGKNIIKVLKKRAELLKDPQIALVEPVIAVVYDKRFKKYREVQVNGIDYS